LGDLAVGSPFQQQSLQRKIIYIVLIVALFCVTAAMRRWTDYGIDDRARNLQLTEESAGEVEMTGAALRLSLIGSRGLVICYLWSEAQDKQKKNQWNELELLVDSLTKLQPHFITPWLFQSWNLAYNVSVESDRIKDKYFYITRGINLEARGERQNRNNPDLRYSIGFYNQHKIGLADEANTLRSLFEMSCIDPIERDPKRLRTLDKNNRTVPDPERFEDFCRKHPLLVRRLREQLKRETPDDIIDFLAEHYQIPSLYEDRAPGSAAAGLESTPLKKREDERFPIQPPADPEGRREVANPTSTKDFGNFHVARDWYEFAQEPLPPPTRDLDFSAPPYDPRRYRMPRYMASLIFRDYPARAQNYIADYLEQEGWFDSEGWKITGWFPDDKFHTGTDALVGTDTDWALNAWKRSFARWKQYGVENGLQLEPVEIKALQERARLYRERHHLGPGMPAPPLLPDERGTELEESRKAQAHLYWRGTYQNMTNFPHFYYEAEVEAEPATIQTRKELYAADQFRKAADQEQAVEAYRQTLPKLAKILKDHPYHLMDPNSQDDAFEVVTRYLDLIDDLYGPRLKQLLVVEDLLAQGAMRSPLATVWLPPVYLVREMRAHVVTPLDDLFTTISMEQQRQRLHAPRPTLIEAPIQMGRGNRPMMR
jgi:hypothetical protein